MRRLVFLAVGALVGAKTLEEFALNASCYTVIYSGNQGPLLNEFRQAKDAFESEPNVCFVEDIKGSFTSTKVVMYPKHDANSARSCLLPGPPPPKVYSGSIALESIVQFINEHAKTHRLPSGEIDPAAAAYNAIEKSLFQVKSDGTTCREVDASEINEELFKEFVLRNEPIVIRNSANSLAQDKSWSTASLLQRIGKRQVHVKVSPNGDFEGCEPLSWWEGDKGIPEFVEANLESPDKILVRPASANMPFSSFIERLHSSSSSEVSYYLEYLSMAAYVPELIQDAPTFSWSMFLELEVSNLWFGDGKSVGKLHFDPFENLMTMVSGSKEFILYDPSDNSRFYEGHIREAQYELEGDTFYRRKLMESTSMVNSPVDINHPELERYPRFAEAHALRCRVDEGDTIFLPSFWWHEVRSSPAKTESRNVAVNYWYKPVFVKDFPCKSCPLRFNKAYGGLLATDSRHDGL